jgi:hypothetical protein
MPTPEQIQQAIQQVKSQRSFMQVLLCDTLGWQIPEQAEDIGDIAYTWSADELNAQGLDQKVVNGRVWQIQPLSADIAKSWGIFVLEFKHKDAFMTGRGLTGPLRSVLRGLVPKRRGQQANLRTWERENLLFICTHKYRHFRFAYFKAPKDKEKTAPLAQFGWNEGDSDIRTLCEHNLLHLDWDLDDPDMDHWREAFSVEKVTKDFYREYKSVFEAVEATIGEKNDISGDDLRLFTQTLFNRLMFLRFIEKKGWLKFNGDTNYLAALYAAGGVGKRSFYRSRLQPLFFEALATEGRQISDAVGEVVFLNGGLFEKTDLDKMVADIPDEAFEAILGREGLFYRFNFTVQESTPLDIEVAVDPEMLGKVFEELVTGRHETGSYYTPRPVVAFMCREAIKGFLSAKTSASPEAIARLVDEHEVAPDLTDKHAEEILFYLETVKAVDPACGSGAYLLGLLQELINVRKTLQNPKLTADPGFLFQLKLRLISQCLYGVDIDPFATNIAKLRLWLSLAVEARTAQPLPNLDFKIETGDSVLGPCDAYAQSADALVMNALRDRALKLVVEKNQYMTAHGEEKTELYNTIKNEEAAIAQETSTALGDGIIAWHVHFAEVFARGRRQRSLEEGAFDSETFKVIVCEPGGFDIVLANPPYIRQELIKDIKARLKEVFPQTYMGTADLYTYFYTRAIEMLGPDGMLVFISSNKWFRANYGKKLRDYVGKNCRVHSITDFKDSPIFEAATAYPMIFVAQRTKQRARPVYTEARVPSGEGLDVAGVIKTQGRPLADDALSGKDWSFADQAACRQIETMQRSGVPLEEYVEGQIYRGILTGLNEAFVIDSETRQQLIEEDPSSKDLIKPLLMGRDIKRWSIEDRDCWLIFTRRGINISKYPAVKRHLGQYKKRLIPRPDDWPLDEAWEGRKPGPYRWFEIQDSIAYFQEFEKPKIVFPDIAPRARFALDLDAHYLGNTGYIIPVQDLYLLGVLNSEAVNEFYTNLSSQVRGDYLRFIYQYVAQIPIPDAPKAEKKAIERLVQKCLDARGENCEQWEREIDERVAALYGL